MISKRPCPYTGVVNYFIAAEPLLAVGSVAPNPRRPRFDWHCYLDDPVAGAAADIATAELELRQAIADRRAQSCAAG
jgi:hypothetical protein